MLCQVMVRLNSENQLLWLPGSFGRLVESKFSDRLSFSLAMVKLNNSRLELLRKVAGGVLDQSCVVWNISLNYRKEAVRKL
jgi:hypothetical protein